MSYVNFKKVAAEPGSFIVQLDLPRGEYGTYENCTIVSENVSPADKNKIRFALNVQDIDKPFKLVRHETVPGPYGSTEREHYIVGPYKVGPTGGVIYLG